VTLIEFFFFQAEDGIRDDLVTGVQTCAIPIYIESIFNIGMLLAPVKVKARADPSPLGRVAKSLDLATDRQLLKRRSDFVGKLISPERSKKVLIEETARTAEKGRGLLKRSVVDLSGHEKSVAAEVAKIRSVTPKNSYQGNLNAIAQENKVMGDQLKKRIGDRLMLNLPGEATRKIDDAIENLILENPVITGNAATVANKIAVKAKQIIEKNRSSPRGLLTARQELDSWIKAQKGSKVFDPELEGSLSVSVRAVRTAMNDILDKNASVAVKDSLKRQSLLYNAMDNLAPKAAAQSNYAVGRLVQDVATVLPFSSKFINEFSTVLGLGLVGGSALLSPGAVGSLASAAIVGRAGYKTVISPTAKKALSSLIKATDKAIYTSKNPSMIKQLRADRALVVELLKKAEVREDDT